MRSIWISLLAGSSVLCWAVRALAEPPAAPAPDAAPAPENSGGAPPQAESPQDPPPQEDAPQEPPRDTPASVPTAEKAPEGPPSQRAPAAPRPAPPTNVGELSDADMDAMFEGEDAAATADVEAPPSEPTRRELSGRELTTIPGTRGDALRAIEVLPGVGRVPFGQSEGPPRLRGSASEDSRVFLDGVPVPLLYHFGGLTSFFNSQLIESVDLRPGNYSARYGRATAGVVDAHVKKAQPERLHAQLELSLIDDYALIDTPVAEGTSLALAGRRSNIDFVYENLVPDGALNVVAAPVYYDYQAILRHDIGKDHQLRLLGYGSHDHINLVFDDANADDPAIHGEVSGKLEFHRVQAHLDSHLGPNVEQHVVLSVGPQKLEQKFGDWTAQFDSTDLYGGARWAILASDVLRVESGLDVESQFFSGSYSGPLPNDSDVDPSSGDAAATLDTVSLTRSMTVVRPGGFVELSYRPLEDLLLLPGVRADYQKEAAAWSVDPRFGARYEATDDLTLKGAAGVYTQPVVYYMLIPEIGNPDVDPERVLQTSLGFEVDPDARVHLDVDAFYKRWLRRIVPTEGGAPPRFENTGEARAYGLETMVRATPLQELDTLVSYTLSRSERNDRGDAWRLYTKDQTHNLSLVASYEVGAGVTFGARFRYVTGNPETPVVGAVYAAELDQYRAVYGPVASARRPAFHQLDVRIDKRWEAGPVALVTYLEVFNVYNAQNEEATSYSYDFSKSEPVSGMPIFPNIGLRGEL